MRRFACSFLAAILASLLTGIALAAEAASLEYQIKAAYIGKLLRFVHWPEPEHGDRELVVAFYGRDVFGAATDRLDGLDVHGRTVRVLRVAALKNVPDGSAVFLSVEDDGMPAALRKLARRPVLTIGESRQFLEHGGMIRFSVVDEAVRFDVNAAAAAGSGLELSSRLLRIGDPRRATHPASHAP